MKIINYVLFFFALSELCSCTSKTSSMSKTKIDISDSLSYKIMSMSDDFYIGKGGSFCILDNYIIGLDFNVEYCFFSINIETKEYVKWGKRGVGPNEFVHPVSIQVIGDNRIGSNDLMTGHYYEIELDSIKTMICMSKKKLADNVAFNIRKDIHNQFICFSIDMEGMYVMYDSIGQRIASFLDLPYADSRERGIETRYRAMAYQGHLVMNPARDKMAFAPSFGDITHFYQIKKNSMDVIKKNEISYPQYTPNEKNNGYSSAMHASQPVTYQDICASNEYIYFLYSGRTIKDNNITAFSSDILRIYNWSGEHIRDVKLNAVCRHLCVSNDNKTIWAIADIPDPQIVTFDLSNLSKKVDVVY